MFKSVHSDRISMAIVDQIKEAVYQKRFKVGDKLPSERELTEQFQTSRVTVREALRTLEYSGILEIKRGVDGGAFVRDPHTKFVNDFLQDMFFMGNIQVPHLTEARMAVEPFAAKVACERISSSALDQIGQNIADTEECVKRNNFKDARLLNLEYHRLIAQASANPVIFFLVDSIMDIMEKNISSIPLSSKPVESTLHYHEEIYQAMKSLDSERVQDLMRHHIKAIQLVLENAHTEPLPR